MPKFLRQHPAIHASLDHLLTNDRVFAASNLTPDDVTATQDDFNMTSLVQTIVGQQLSVKAAATIWGRVAAAVDVTDPRAILGTAPDDLRALGLSYNKIKYVHGIAQATLDGSLDFKALKKADNDTVIAALTALKGFGVWSAHMVLIFALCRPDIWPAGDLGVQSGLQIYRKLKERPDQKATHTYGLRKFGPAHHTAAALLLWRLKDRAAPSKN